LSKHEFLTPFLIPTVLFSLAPQIQIHVCLIPSFLQSFVLCLISSCLNSFLHLFIPFFFLFFLFPRMCRNYLRCFFYYFQKHFNLSSMLSGFSFSLFNFPITKYKFLMSGFSKITNIHLCP